MSFYGLLYNNIAAYADEIANATTSTNSLTVGAVTQVAPSYSGSNHSKLSMLPVIQAYDGELFFDSTKGIDMTCMIRTIMLLVGTMGLTRLWWCGKENEELIGKTDKNHPR